MDNSQRALRRAAAEAFSRSLDQLAVCFEPEDKARLGTQPFKQPVLSHSTSGVSSIEALQLEALEDAAADIEQLFRQAD